MTRLGKRNQPHAKSGFSISVSYFTTATHFHAETISRGNEVIGYVHQTNEIEHFARKNFQAIGMKYHKWLAGAVVRDCRRYTYLNENAVLLRKC